MLAAGPVLDVSLFGAIAAENARADGRRIATSSPATIGGGQPPVIALSSLSLADAEETLIEAALRAANNNRTRAAALLGIGVRRCGKN